MFSDTTRALSCPHTAFCHKQCEEVQFVDVREQHEMDTASLPNFRLFPLSLSEEWGPHISTMLNPDMETVVR